MKLNYTCSLTVIVISVLLSDCKEKDEMVSSDEFLGEWYSIKGDIEAYSFLKDSSSYLFVGTQNMRPVAFGTWKASRDKFILIMDDGTILSYSYSLNNDTLIFNEGEQEYTRTEPLEACFPEVRILKAISGDMSNLKFSDPFPSDLIRCIHSDSLASSGSSPLKGYAISASVPLSSRAPAEIITMLEDFGFEQDTVQTNEICTCCRDENQIVTVCCRPAHRSEKDSVIIVVTSAILVN